MSVEKSGLPSALAPGDYDLVLNARNEVPNAFDAPYARTYYPATVDKREAEKIRVTEGAMIENLAMRVGPRMIERTVAGTVVWSGHALENPYLAVYSGEAYVGYVQVKDGTFKFTLYGDFDYSIEARDFSDGIEGRSQRLKIPQKNATTVKLVIQRIKRSPTTP